MTIFFSIVGITGFAACALLPERMDTISLNAWRRGRAWIQVLLRHVEAPEPDLIICSRLMASLRGGISLDSAIQSALRSEGVPPSAANRLRHVLEGKPGADFLSVFLVAALQSGMPVLATLQTFQQMLAGKHRLRLRSRSLTGQARAQAEVLAWLPWGLAAAIFLADREWFFQAARSPLAWFLWAAAIALTGAGRRWISWLLNRALGPKSPEEALEEEALPELTLRVLAEISMGTDAESSLERALNALRKPDLSRAFSGAEGGTDKIRALKAMLSHAAATGAPLRQDLQNFLQTLYLELEARWEERVQRLPVVLLMPLFLCFFPGTLLVIGSLLFPLLRDLP